MRSQDDGMVHLEWASPAAGEWELRGEEGLVARLSHGERGCVAEAQPNAWTLQRVGFHHPRVVVRPVGALAEIAHVQSDWRGIHGLHFASGPSWEIDPSHSAGTVVRDETGAVVMRLAWNGRFDAPGARVTAAVETISGRFGPISLVVAGFLFLETLGDPARRISLGVPLGATARTRFQD